MAAPKKYPDELRERAVRLTLEARKDPATAIGAIKRVADQLGIHPFADLRRVTDQAGRYRWVHWQFLTIYQPPLPGIPTGPP
jgi:transposase-like protein